MSVQGGSLPTSDLDSAHRTVERLRTDELLPVCRPPAPVAPPTAAPAPGQPGAVVPTTAAPAPGVPAPTAVTAAPPPVSTSPQVPGRDCRRVQ
jgi:PPM family protein phosphatase